MNETAETKPDFLTLLLQPERRADETQDAYKARRVQAANYVEAQQGGDMVWSSSTGQVTNRLKKQEQLKFGKGKAAKKMVKRAMRVMRQHEQEQQQA